MGTMGVQASIALTLMIALAASGCIVKPTSEPNDTETYTVTVEAAPPDGTGDLAGVVTDSYHVPVVGAHVSVVGTPRFASTDNAGSFAIPGLDAGAYTVRVDAVRFLSFETQTKIGAGQVSRLAIQLETAAECRTHVHDYWQGRTEVTLADDLPVDLNDGADLASNPQGALETGVLDPTNGGPDRVFTLAKDALVFPGTAKMVVTFDWDASEETMNFERLGFAFRPADGGEVLRVEPHARGESWSIPLKETMADPAHAQKSEWQYFFYHAGGEPSLAFGTVQATIKIHKGELTMDSCSGHQHALPA